MAHHNKEKKNKKRSFFKSGMIVLIIIGIIAAIKLLGLSEYFRLENVQNLKNWISQFGIIGPIIFVLIYIGACLFFLPGLPVTIFGALAFGPIMGTLWSSIGSTLGASAAFLVARYAARDMVETWVEGNQQFRKIDEGVEKQGWRMLMITRLIPIFPFNLQNFAYGLTKIKFSNYVLVSWICMLPASIAYNFMAGAIVTGDGNITKPLMYLGVGAVILVIISLIPGWLRKKKQVNV
jgi:uncharacterized membrane protein YdjX (TVP38/TMEM64 family)